MTPRQKDIAYLTKLIDDLRARADAATGAECVRLELAARFYEAKIK